MPLLAALLAAALAVSCGAPDGPPEAAGGPFQIVVTTTILGDLVGELAGDRAEVEVLMPVGADAHSFAPSAAQAAAVRDADLVVINGLGLEEGLADLIHAAEEDGVGVFAAAEEVDTIAFDDEPAEERHDAEGEDDDHTADDHEQAGDADPHVWMDPLRMADAMKALGDRLATADDAGDWLARADALASELEQLDADVAEILAVVPAERRQLVTNHEAMGYFADRYDFAVVATVIPGGTTLAEPSATDLEAVVEVIRALGVPAIFAETTRPARLAEAVAAEVGHEVEVVELFTESLSEPDGPAATYPDMLRTNAQRIAEALG